jgi:hypothetical protein
VKLSPVAQLSAVVEELIRFQAKPGGDDVSGKQPGDMVEVEHSASPQLHPTDLISLHLRVNGYSEKPFSPHSPMYFFSSSPHSKRSNYFATCRVNSMSKISRHGISESIFAVA